MSDRYVQSCHCQRNANGHLGRVELSLETLKLGLAKHADAYAIPPKGMRLVGVLQPFLQRLLERGACGLASSDGLCKL